MSFFNVYIKRYKPLKPFLSKKPKSDLHIVIVIPCYNESDLPKTIDSLLNCNLTKNSVEIIVVINSSENDSEYILNQNNKTENYLKIKQNRINSDKYSLHYIHVKDIRHKFAGAGYARKIGMDEALQRFSEISNEEGIIASFDADTICEQNYLKEIETEFNRNKKLRAATVYFEHDISGEKYDKKQYQAITLYELYLRYYIHYLRYIKFPFAFHTIGSAFAVNVKTYADVGGMNRKKAGEDFYFLHKIFPNGYIKEINSTCVYPSSRTSDRVPFGTGVVVGNLLKSDNIEYSAYNPKAFEILKIFFEQIDEIYFDNSLKYNSLLNQFLRENNFEQVMYEIRAKSSNLKVFRKHFFTWFDAFRILKFLNYIHEDNTLSKISIKNAAVELLKKINKLNKNIDEKELLMIFRKIEINKSYSFIKF